MDVLNKMFTTSIIIRALNEAKHIDKLLYGISQQTIKPDEIILVDSGSTDDTIKKAQKYNVKVIKSENAEADDIVATLTKIFDKTSTLKYSSNIDSLNFNQIQDKEVLTLNDGDYIEIREHGIKQLFNGSILIQFNDFQNLQNFADQNDLIFVNAFSNISVGVFKVPNVLDLEIIINNLQKDSNITAIDLNTIKSVKPR